MQGNDIKLMGENRKISKRGRLALAAGTAALLLWLWACRLPDEMFGETPYSTVVTANDGSLLGARVADDGQWRFPPCDTVHEKFAKALIEYEDRGFYGHYGVSIRGIGRALKQNISNGRVVSGGSTISMQTIRLQRRGPRTIGEKLIEMGMATMLEARYTKGEILRMYASHAPFGGNVVGIGAAVWRYLGNDGNDMSWAEAATLAVLQNAPSAIHLAKNRDKLLAKRNRLLKRLHEKGEIDEDEYLLATEEPLIGKPCPMPTLAPHLVEHYHKTRHGQATRTDIRPTLQRRVESLAQGWREELALSGIRDLAIVVAETGTGRVIVYCGNADLGAEREGKWVDIARSPRSSGSILKPLLYCAALQEGAILESTLLPDTPTDFGGFAPKNFDGGYSGAVAANDALALSLNVPNVHLLKEYGTGRFASLLKKMGICTLTRPAGEYGLSLILGGAEVTLLEMTRCYARLAGMSRDFALHDSMAIHSTLEAMRDVNRPDELDYGRASTAQNVAWKTGTSYGARDGWAIGVTPGYAVGVWAGNADGSGVADLTGARTAGPVMFDVFNLLPHNGWFDEPEGGAKARICMHSGHLAGRYCDETEIRTVAKEGLNSRTCPYCQELPVSTDGMRRVENGAEPMEMRAYFTLPPLMKHFYKQHHADYIEPPAAQGGEGHIKIIYPADGAVLSVPRDEENRLVFKATHANAGATLFWHLDEGFVGATGDLHQIQANPGPGAHRLAVVDESGAQAVVEFVVR